MNKKIIFLSFVILVIVSFIVGWVFGTSSLVNSESKELECLLLYKDIWELNHSPEMATSEREATSLQYEQIMKYVEMDCPEFRDLDLMYQHMIKNYP